MKWYTDSQIKEKAQEIWDNVQSEHGYKYSSPDDIQVRQGDDRVEIELSSMYNAPSLTFYHLKALSDFFDTEHIMDHDRFSYSGCETCDYGSSYGFTLTIREDNNDKKTNNH